MASALMVVAVVAVPTMVAGVAVYSDTYSDTYSDVYGGSVAIAAVAVATMSQSTPT